MPVKREYIFNDGTVIEVDQSIEDISFTRACHPETGELEDVKRYYRQINTSFKGSGFYRNDK